MGPRWSDPGPRLRTPRLLLRRWNGADLAPFAALNADPVVMAYFPAPLTREQSDASVARIEAGFDARGFGLWAVEVTSGEGPGGFVGFTGLAVPGFEAAFTPAVEIGWRLARPAWGHGYATEAAAAALDFALTECGLAEVVSFTSTTNMRSQRVMQRLGMTHDPAEDFDHPELAPGHPLRQHVLYRVRTSEWGAAVAASTGRRLP